MTGKEGAEAKPQIDRFREAARELGCDESEERFDAALVKVAKAPPPKEQRDELANRRRSGVDKKSD